MEANKKLLANMTDYERLKYYAARYVWPRKYFSPPRSPDKTWIAWWEEKFKDDYDLYIKTLQKREGKPWK